MNIKSVGLNSFQNTSFGLITDNALNRFYPQRYIQKGKELDTFLKIINDNDFILNHNDKKARFELYATNYQTSYFFPDPKDKFPKIELMEAILDKMAKMKKKFHYLPKRATKMTLMEFNG